MNGEFSEELNLTLTNFTEEKMIDKNPLGAALLLVNYFIMEVFGNGMLIVMILYERFAMDPQKRFVNNMLLSCLCFTAILSNIVPISSMTYDTIYEPLGKLFYVFPLNFDVFRPSFGPFDCSNLCRDYDFSSTFIRRNCHY